MKRHRGARTGERVIKSDEEWGAILSPEQYAVLRQGATERAGTGRYASAEDAGTYCCAACGQALFSSETKYDSGTGWPSFSAPADPEAVARVRDVGLLGVRTEVRCRSCASHLGHVFRDGPTPTGDRYCMNSAALRLDAASDEPGSRS